MRWYHWLFLPFIILIAAAIGIYVVSRDRFDQWRYDD